MKAREHGAFRTLPEPYFWFIPELDELDWPEEARADCSDCVMLLKPEESPPRPRNFNPKTRCCTYHPNLANFLVGRLLRDGGRGAELIRARMTDLDGIETDGMNPLKSRTENDPYGQVREFGQAERFRCPFYTGEDLSCGVWPHREAVCRTWFCLYEDGFTGGEFWAAIRDVLYVLERKLEQWCTEQGTPPPPDATSEQWQAWYVWCANRLDSATRDELAPVADDDLAKHREKLRRWYRDRHAPLADVLEPAIGLFVKGDECVMLYGESYWDALRVPKSVFQLLSRLDDKTPWREALGEARKAAGDELDEALVRRLSWAGALMPPGWDDLDPDDIWRGPAKAEGGAVNPAIFPRGVPKEALSPKPRQAGSEPDDR